MMFRFFSFLTLPSPASYFLLLSWASLIFYSMPSPTTAPKASFSSLLRILSKDWATFVWSAGSFSPFISLSIYLSQASRYLV